MEPACREQPNATGLPVSLLQLLSNTLVLYQTTPYLPVKSLLALGATSKPFRDLVHSTPNVFRHLDLTKVHSAQFKIAAIDHGGEVWRNVQLDENVTEDDFYGGPLRGIFHTLKRRNILRDVQTLVLDGLSVTSDLVADIILQDDFSVRILSIREVQNLNERKLQKALEYAVRPNRPANTPRLKGLYIFGSKDAARTSHFGPRVDRQQRDLPSGGVMHSLGAQIGSHWNQKSGDALAEIFGEGDKWYQNCGRVLPKPPSTEWASTMYFCDGLISFDAVLCNGPRHEAPFTETAHNWFKRPDAYLPPRVATHAVPGCSSCGSAPEGFSKFELSPLRRFPLLAPPPLHSSTLKSAKTPFPGSDNKLLVRCQECLRARFCESCKKWWCEECYEIPNSAHHPPWEFADGEYTNSIKVDMHLGLCVETCLVAEMMSGAGSFGMWG